MFLRAGQEFLWAPDLKADLKHANAHFQAFPDDVKVKGIMAFAHSPPGGDDSLMVKLLDRHAPGWRKGFANNIIKDPVKNEKLAAKIRRTSQSTPLTDDDLNSEPSEADSLTIQRLVSKRRGNWWQLPADLKNDDESNDL